MRNYELDPETRKLVSSLSGGKAVGAFIMRRRSPRTGRSAVIITPVGRDKILFDPAYKPIRRFVRLDAHKDFKRMFEEEQ